MCPASRSEGNYFERIGAANRTLGGESVPGSLAEPGIRDAGEGDWPSHMAFLDRIRTTGRRGGTKRA